MNISLCTYEVQTNTRDRYRVVVINRIKWITIVRLIIKAKERIIIWAKVMVDIMSFTNQNEIKS